ncbi:hypothetical protein NDN08_003593 [Rhodosorus marinus]|uniref:RNA helicase n=1 Tax=Rhodosorus marinus TaxID=101924 RepID=A0AAV8UZT8_9RHOD|nr:hypothetical protein NDN08_003593 [Rhodosorus marinus]
MDENDFGLDFPGVESDEDGLQLVEENGEVYRDERDDNADDLKQESDVSKKKKKKLKEGSFEALGIDDQVRRSLVKNGYRFPTPIQRKVIPEIIAGRDVVAMGRTGSGKTCAFLAPLLTLLKRSSLDGNAGSISDELPRGLVLSPTRELAIQTHKFFRSYSRGTGLRATLIVGGGSIEKQFAALTKSPQVLIATPGRLLQVLDEMKHYSLRGIELVIYDEVDRLFEGTLSADLMEIVKRMGGDAHTGVQTSRQSVLVSATLPSSVAEFSRAGLRPGHAFVRLDVEKTFSPTLATAFYAVKPDYKDASLLFILRNQILSKPRANVVIFSATRHHVEYLVMLLERAKLGVGITSVHGSMDQVGRQNAVSSFRSGRSRILVVTDVAARGIDIPMLDSIVNYDYPCNPKLFVHRVGRVARSNRTGTAYSLVTPEEMPYMVDTFLFQGYDVATERDEKPEGVPEDTRPDFLKLLRSSFCLGRLPSTPLEDEEEWIRATLAAGDELTTQRQSLVNAHKLYTRTRGRPSSLSVHKVKELTAGGVDMLPVHLWLRGSEFQQDADDAHDIASRMLSKWRPKESQIAASTRIRKNVEQYKHNKAESEKLSSQYEDDEAPELEAGEANEILGTNTGNVKGASSKRQKLIEAQKTEFFLPLQYAASRTSTKENAMKLDKEGNERDQMNAAVLDLTGEDADDLRAKNATRKVWDRKRKKYVGAGALDSLGKRVKKNEAGRRIHVDSKSSGETYKRWVKRSRGAGGSTEASGSGGVRQSGGRNRGKGRQSQELRSRDQIRKHRTKAASKEDRVQSKKRRLEEMKSGKGGAPRPSKQGKGKAWSKSKQVSRR